MTDFSPNSASPNSGNAAPPLAAGLRVLDLSRVLAGPYAAMTLGDLGASVIKVEQPGRGDETRRWGPPFDADGESAYYLSINRNKLGITLDLTDREDRAVLLGLLTDADVVIENFLTVALERLGLSPGTLLMSHPNLIWCTIGGFGKDPNRPGYDFAVQAESGWMSVNGVPDGEPLRGPVAIVDVLTGKDAAIAILAALLRRERQALTAGERHVSISLMHSAVAALVNVAQNVLVSRVEARRWGNGHPNIVPYQLFHARDGDVVIAVGTDSQWRACTSVLGLTELTSDETLSTNAGRLAERERVVGTMAEAVTSLPAAGLIAELTAVGVPCGRVRSVSDAVAEVRGSPLTGIPPSVPGTVRLPPPRLDEHGELIRTHGWSAFSNLASGANRD
ncbi:MAG TPA: CoA transferase [Gemmatimonadaceae bacterium]|nr:CoA transferase [Gemmatimonadaceae bacterium]